MHAHTTTSVARVSLHMCYAVCPYTCSLCTLHNIYTTTNVPMRFVRGATIHGSQPTVSHLCCTSHVVWPQRWELPPINTMNLQPRGLVVSGRQPNQTRMMLMLRGVKFYVSSVKHTGRRVGPHSPTIGTNLSVRSVGEWCFNLGKHKHRARMHSIGLLLVNWWLWKRIARVLIVGQ